MPLSPIVLYPGGHRTVPVACQFPSGEIPASEDDRIHWVMHLLIDGHAFSVDAAAGLVGNLRAESGVLPNRIEGSSAASPLRAPSFAGASKDFSPEDVMNRNADSGVGPRLPGIGLAQWTSTARRAGLFQFAFKGQTLGAKILFDMEAQVEYLMHELAQSFHAVDVLLRGPGVSMNDACDEVAYRFEVPGVVLDGAGGLLPRDNPQVQNLFATRRQLALHALQVYKTFHP